MPSNSKHFIEIEKLDSVRCPRTTMANATTEFVDDSHMLVSNQTVYDIQNVQSSTLCYGRQQHIPTIINPYRDIILCWRQCQINSSIAPTTMNKSLAAMLKYSVLTNQSAKRINSLKESNKYKSLDRVWFIKSDLGLLAKIHNKSTDEEWPEYLKLLKQCKARGAK